MSATIVDIADQIVEWLRSAELSQPINPVRMYEPRFEVAELAELRTSVVPFSTSIERATRSNDYFDFGITIGIQRRVEDAKPETIDPLILLVEDVAAVLRKARLPGWSMQALEIDPVFDPEDLRELRVFTSIITVTFRATL